MKNKTIGLDIGSTSIKVAALRKDGQSIVLEAVAGAPGTQKGLSSESPADLDKLSQSIKILLTSSNIKATSVAISLPESQVYTKVIEMPNLSEQELSSALKFEMEQYVPLPLDQARTDWQILGKTDNGGKKTLDVMLVAAPASTIDKYDKLVTKVGLVPEVIETEIVSVHRALLPVLNSSPANLMVHMGASTTSAALVLGGIIKSVFSLPVGGMAITRAISVDLGIDLNQAENYKRAYGLNKDVFEGKIGKALSPILESISGDIKKTALSFKERTGTDVNQIVLSGGTALLPGIDSYFTNQIGVQVVLGNCFTAYNIQNVPPELAAEAPSYNVVMGLALRNLL